MTDAEIMLRCIEARSQGAGVLPVKQLLTEALLMFQTVKGLEHEGKRAAKAA